MRRNIGKNKNHQINYRTSLENKFQKKRKTSLENLLPKKRKNKFINSL